MAECDRVLNNTKYSWRNLRLRTVRESGFSDGPWSIYVSGETYGVWQIQGGGWSRRQALESLRNACISLAKSHPAFVVTMDKLVKAREAEYRALGIDPSTLRSMPLFGTIDPLHPECAAWDED